MKSSAGHGFTVHLQRFRHGFRWRRWNDAVWIGDGFLELIESRPIKTISPGGPSFQGRPVFIARYQPWIRPRCEGRPLAPRARHMRSAGRGHADWLQRFRLGIERDKKYTGIHADDCKPRCSRSDGRTLDDHSQASNVFMRSEILPRFSIIASWRSTASMSNALMLWSASVGSDRRD